MTTFKIKKDQHKTITLTKSGDYIVELIGEGAEVTIEGRWLMEKTQELKVKLLIHHQAANTQAITTLKAVGTDKAQISLAGKIVVDKQCNGVNSFLTERVLLLSETAKAEAIPDLEIESNEVKCSHAASIASINEEQRFYLQSRGISKNKAEELIIKGFLQ